MKAKRIKRRAKWIIQSHTAMAISLNNSGRDNARKNFGAMSENLYIQAQEHQRKAEMFGDLFWKKVC